MCNNQEEDNNLYIRCINCGEVYTVDPNDYPKHDLSYRCDKCGSEMIVRFFGYCANCDVHIGFTDNPNDSTVSSFIKGAFEGYFNPLETISSLFDSIPRANKDGVCMNCGLRHIECPQCGEAVFVPMDANPVNDVFQCQNCGCRMRHP